jgi:5'(3')-deoxyribonucleotidase
MSNKNKPQIFIDMDGVFVDFLGGCLEWFGVKDKTIEKDWPEREWGDEKILKQIFGVNGNIFWGSIATNQFWANLDWQSDGREFIDFISPHKPVILTSPSYKAATGKQMWIKKNLPEYYKDNRYLIGPAKKYVARAGAILIDDCEKNITDWKERFGLGILYPRYWNKLSYIETPLNYVMELVNYYMRD